MAAATSTPPSLYLPSQSQTLRPRPKTLVIFSTSSVTLQRLCRRIRPNGARSGGGALSARMVSAPSIAKAPPSLDFESKVFKKEKVTLAGHDEVRLLSIFPPLLSRFFFMLILFRKLLYNVFNQFQIMIVMYHICIFYNFV
jgi:hypothetical protein